jgi:ABC-type sugar transport system permease subunit
MLIDYALQMAVYIPVIISFSMAVALLLNLKIRGQGLFRTIFFLPVISPAVRSWPNWPTKAR